MTMPELEKMTVALAVEVLKVTNSLIDNEQKSLADWFFHSGTQIGVRVAKASASYETEDFISEMKEAFSQANKTLYWLDILYDNELIDRVRYEFIKYKCNCLRIEINKAVIKAKNVN